MRCVLLRCLSVFIAAVLLSEQFAWADPGRATLAPAHRKEEGPMEKLAFHVAIAQTALNTSTDKKCEAKMLP